MQISENSIRVKFAEARLAEVQLPKTPAVMASVRSPGGLEHGIGVLPSPTPPRLSEAIHAPLAFFVRQLIIPFLAAGVWLLPFPVGTFFPRLSLSHALQPPKTPVSTWERSLFRGRIDPTP